MLSAGKQKQYTKQLKHHQTGPSRGETLTTSSKMFSLSTWRRMRWTLRPQRAEINHYTHGSRVALHLQTKQGYQAFHQYLQDVDSVPSENCRRFGSTVSRRRLSCAGSQRPSTKRLSPGGRTPRCPIVSTERWPGAEIQ